MMFFVLSAKNMILDVFSHLFFFALFSLSNICHAAKQTAQYTSYLPDSCTDAFRSAAKTHHIRHIPVFLTSGKLVPTEELLIRLEDAVVEVMFSLKHYYYGPATNKFKQTKVGNTFTATIEQVTILQINTITPSPLREPAMKTILSTPPNAKGKTPVRSKRASSHPPLECSPSQSKKTRIEGIYHRRPLVGSLTVLDAGASSSSSTITQNEEESREESDIMQSLT
jgi:hypothetical protein